MPEEHPIRVLVGKDSRGRWEITVTGVTSGAVVNYGDGDTGSVTFYLDASRFTPVRRK